jgi:transcription termination factor Rho
MQMGNQDQDKSNPNRTGQQPGSNQQQGAGQGNRQQGQGEQGRQEGNRQQGGGQDSKRQQEQQGGDRPGQSANPSRDDKNVDAGNQAGKEDREGGNRNPK